MCVGLLGGAMRGDLIPIQHADWNTDHLGTNHLCANRISISWANHERAHHVRAHHVRANNLRANHSRTNRSANCHTISVAVQCEPMSERRDLLGDVCGRQW